MKSLSIEIFFFFFLKSFSKSNILIVEIISIIYKFLHVPKLIGVELIVVEEIILNELYLSIAGISPIHLHIVECCVEFVK